MIPWELALSFFLGLALLYLFGQLLVWPRRFLWRLMAASLLGGLALFALNLLSPLTGLTVPLSPFTVLAAGLLGLPGVALMAALCLIC